MLFRFEAVTLPLKFPSTALTFPVAVILPLTPASEAKVADWSELRRKASETPPEPLLVVKKEISPSKNLGSRGAVVAFAPHVLRFRGTNPARTRSPSIFLFTSIHQCILFP